MRKISDNTNKIIHGILGMVLNFFYFFVSYVYVKNEFPRHIVWDIVLGIIFAVWVLYCFTFGIKWEMKHLEEKAKKIEQQEDELLSGKRKKKKKIRIICHRIKNQK